MAFSLTEESLQTLLLEATAWSVQALGATLVILVLFIAASALVKKLLGFLRRSLVSSFTSQVDIATEEREKRISTLLTIVAALLKVFLISIAFFMILQNLGIDLAPLIAGAGIMGVAIGFGAKGLIQDLFAGFFLLLENQIRLKDSVTLNSVRGTVEHLGIRTTLLRDLTGSVHVFRNGSISRLSNHTREWSAAVLDIGVAYKEDTDAVSEIMQRVAEQMQTEEQFKVLMLEPLEIFGVDAFADSAVVIKARIKTVAGKQKVCEREFRRRLKQAFDAAGVEIPFPHKTIYWGEDRNAVSIQHVS